MPLQCCRCNGQGRCRSWKCVRNGVHCSNCTPGRNGRCENHDGSATVQVAARPPASPTEVSMLPGSSEESTPVHGAGPAGGRPAETAEGRNKELLPGDTSLESHQKLSLFATVMRANDCTPLPVTSPSSLRIPVDENTPISLGASLPQVVCTSQEAASLASLQAVIDRSYCIDFRPIQHVMYSFISR